MSCPTMMRLIIGTIGQDMQRGAPVASLESSTLDLTSAAAAIETGTHPAAVRSLAGLAMMRALDAVHAIRQGWPAVAARQIAEAEGLAEAAEHLAVEGGHNG